MKKKAKPATAAQKKARERNWNKGQIYCINAIAHKIFECKTTPPEERRKLRKIMTVADSIARNWTKLNG